MDPRDKASIERFITKVGQLPDTVRHDLAVRALHEAVNAGDAAPLTTPAELPSEKDG